MSTIIAKPWGQEIILTEPNLPYTGKILEVKAGSRLSLQSHDQKVETLTLINGQANITLNNEILPMKVNYGHTVRPNTVHRIEAVTDSTIFEVSTPEIGTTTRLEDDYNRPDETPDVRNSPNRGWQN
jgi:mannose-6-phosphate isomerase